MEMKGRNQHKWELYQRAEASIIAVISYFSTIPVVVPAAVFHVGLLPSLYLSRAVHPACLCEALFSATGHIQPHVSSLHCPETTSDTTSFNREKESHWTPNSSRWGWGNKDVEKDC